MAASNSPVEENESPHDHMIEEMSLEQFKLLRHLPFGLRPQFDVNILTYCPQPVSKEEKTIYPFRFQVGTVENRGKFYGLWAFLQKAEKFADIVFFIKWDENRLLYFPIQDQRDGWMVSVKLIPELSGLDLTPEHASAIAKFVLLKYGLLPVISYMGRDIPVFDCGGSGWIKSLFEACNIFKNKVRPVNINILNVEITTDLSIQDKAVLNPNPPQPTSPPLVKQNNSPEAPVQKQANRSRNTVSIQNASCTPPVERFTKIQ